LKCITDECTNETEILLVVGTCKVCEDYSHPDEEKKNCIADQCEPYQILLKDGTCSTCEAYFHPDAETGYTCVESTCDKSEETLDSSYACVLCDDYTYPDATGLKCIVDECTPETQFLDTTGKCGDCASYTYTAEDGKSCIFDECDYLL